MHSVATSSGATETITLSTDVNGNATVKIGGTTTEGDTLTFTTNNVALPGGSKSETYTVLSGDTITSISAGLTALINGDPDLVGIGISATGSSTANLAWSESFSGSAALTEGMNLIAVTAVDALPNTASVTLQLSVVGAASTALTYDLNGNMTFDGTNSYAWDGENRLIQITYPGSGNSTALAYDGLSRCVSIVGTRAGSVTSTKQFVWSGNMRCEARDASSAVTAQFFGLGEVIGGTNYFYTKDHLGSIREMTDSSGTIVAQYGYDMYGQPTQTIASQSADFGFAGMYFHAPSGLNLATYRAYNPSTGRWINRDPIGGGGNLYAYCFNDSVNLRDRSGLIPNVDSGQITSPAPDTVSDPAGQTMSNAGQLGFDIASGIDSFFGGMGDVVSSVIKWIPFVPPLRRDIEIHMPIWPFPHGSCPVKKNPIPAQPAPNHTWPGTKPWDPPNLAPSMGPTRNI